MKILVIAPTPFFAHRGTHIRIYEQVSALSALGHKMTILTYPLGENPHWSNKQVEILRVANILPWYHKLEAGPSWQKIIFDALLFLKGIFFIIKIRPQIIHAHLHEGILVGWLLKRIFFFLDIKLVADFHGGLVQEMVEQGYLRIGLVRKVFGLLERFIATRGDMALTSSPEIQSEINKHRVNKDAVLMADSVSPSFFEGRGSSFTGRVRWGLPSNKKIVTYTGAFSDNKGINELLALFESLNKEYSSLHFVLAGAPASNLKSKNFSETLKNNITIISPLSYFDLPELLKSSDIAIDPKPANSLQGSGKIIAYMAAGLPVVAIDRKTNAFYSEEYHGTMLEQAKKIIEDSVYAKAQGAKNQNRVKNFSSAERAQEIDKIYQAVYGITKN